MKRGQGWFITAFLSPAVLLYGLFVVWPLFQAFNFSFYRWHGVSAHRKFVGLHNYQKLAGDDALHKALSNNLLLLFVGGILTLVLAVAIAHALQRTIQFDHGIKRHMGPRRPISLCEFA